MRLGQNLSKLKRTAFGKSILRIRSFGILEKKIGTPFVKIKSPQPNNGGIPMFKNYNMNQGLFCRSIWK